MMRRVHTPLPMERGTTCSRRFFLCGERAVAFALFFAVLLLFAPTIFAADESGGTDTVFRLGPTARGVGLSSAMVGLANDASAPYWNPALLPHVNSSAVAFSYNRLYSLDTGASYSYLGMVYPTLNAGGFGLGFLRLSLGGIDTYDSFSRPTGTVDYAETEMLFSYGYGAGMPILGGRFDLGLSAKIHSLELSERATSGGMDFAVAWQPPRLASFRFSFVYQNLVAPSFRLVDVEDTAPSTQRFALSHHRKLGESAAVDLAVDYDKPEFADSRIALGGEFSYRNLYTVRAGIDAGQVSAGLGGRWRAYSLDYAFRSGGELGSSQFITFSWYFGESLQNRRQRQIQEREQELQEARMEAVERWRQDEADRAVTDLKAHLEKKELDAADQDLARARGYGASAAELDTLQTKLEREREEQVERLIANQVHQSRVQEAEQAVRSALAGGDPETARLTLARLEALAPDHPMLSRLNQDVEALVAGEVARAAEKATTAEQQGHWETALRSWSLVARLDPANPGPEAAQARWKALLEAARTDSEEAKTQAKRARRQLIEEQRYTQALEHFAQGELDAATFLCNEILAAQPGHAGATRLLQRIEVRRKGPRRLSEKEADAVRRYYLSGLSHFTDGDYEAAIVQWERILQIDPDNQGAKNNIAEAKSRLKSLHGSQESNGGGSW